AEAYLAGTVPSLARAMFVRVLHGLGDQVHGPREGDWLKPSEHDVSVSLLPMFDPEHKELGRQLWSDFARLLVTFPDWTPMSPDDEKLVGLFSSHGCEFERSEFRARVSTIEAAIDRALAAPGPNQWKITALHSLPRGYRCFYAMHWVDAEVRNGGFDQLYRNSGGIEVPDAIAAHQATEQLAIAGVVAESLRYGRQRKPSLVHESVQINPVLPGEGAPRSWRKLDEAYYQEPNAGAEALVRNCNELFNPSWRVLTHPDGRVWRIRENGTRVELQIELPGGEMVDRELRLGLGELASDAIASRIGKQLELGFVESG
ncbi:MAG: DUF4375 domain-containing protein, partial [Myxococcota bacterium]